MDVSDNIENMGFDPEHKGEKPGLDQIQDFFDNRLKQSDAKAGIEVSRDELGNFVYRSLNKTEATFAGDYQSELIATEEGRSVVVKNKGLLKNINRGRINPIGESLGGAESEIYRIRLETNRGQDDFAVKYFFPNSMDEIDSTVYYYTSGIAAMHIMQMAQAEQPIPYVKFAVPILATHDMTVAPFVEDAVNTEHLLGCLGKPTYGPDREEFEEMYGLTSEQKDLLQEMQSYEASAGKDKKFYSELEKVLEGEKETLVSWVDNKVKNSDELTKLKYDSADTSLKQSVTTVQSVYKIFKRFISDNEFNAKSSDFSKAVLENITLVELGFGKAEIPNSTEEA